MRFRNIFASSTIVCLSLGGRWLNLYCTKLFTPLKGGKAIYSCSSAILNATQAAPVVVISKRTDSSLVTKTSFFPIRKQEYAQRESCLRSQPMKSDKTQKLGAAILCLLQSWSDEEKIKTVDWKGQNPPNNKIWLFRRITLAVQSKQELTYNEILG